MLIRIEREAPLPDAIPGVLLVDGAPLFVTREPAGRPDRAFVPGESALPAGLYNLTLCDSPRHGRPVPLIVSTLPTVERRSAPREGGPRATDRLGMRFHPGEPAVDSGSEIVLGLWREEGAVRQTAIAFEQFSAIIRAAIDRGEAIEVEIN